MVRSGLFSAPSACALTLALAACGGGGGSTSTPTAGPIGGGAAPTPTITTATLPAGENTSFVDRTAALGFGHSFGFSDGLNVMVAQFAGGAATGDIDGDGDLDIFIARGDLGPNLLYINDGGAFVESA